jgi:copper chaperone CopZ/bacterioferritin-associated ferredoxin
MKTAEGKEVPVSQEFINLPESDREKYCAACGKKGTKIFPTTMRNHVQTRYWQFVDDSFRFSDNPDCNVYYFSNRNGLYFMQNEVKTVYGRKVTEGDRPLCYCIGVTERDIEEEVLKKECCDSLEDVEAYTKAGTGKWCFITNPSGKCCREYLPEVVSRYLALVRKPRVRKMLQDVADQLKGVEVDMRPVEFSISSMTCESCTIAVANAIESAGGSRVKVSLREGRASAFVPKTVLSDDIARVVTDAGYETSVLTTPRKEA